MLFTSPSSVLNLHIFKSLRYNFQKLKFFESIKNKLVDVVGACFVAYGTELVNKKMRSLMKYVQSIAKAKKREINLFAGFGFAPRKPAPLSTTKERVSGVEIKRWGHPNLASKALEYE